MDGELAHLVGPHLDPDPRRVIAQLFVPGEEQPGSRSRANGVVARVLALSEDEVTELAASVVRDFRGRHRDLMGAFSTTSPWSTGTVSAGAACRPSGGC